MEYRIDELARLAATTVRNVRAYQDRGLVPPPRREGRIAYYAETHLARLRMIGTLLERGYSLQNITELIGFWERGNDLRDLLGLEAALTSPFSDDVPQYFTVIELAEMFGKITPDELMRTLQLGVLEVKGAQFRAPSPRLLRAAAELNGVGVPVHAALDELELLRGDVERIAQRFVALVVEHVINKKYTDAVPSPDKAPEITHIIERLRPLAKVVVEAQLAKALEKQLQEQVGTRIAKHLERANKKAQKA